MAVQRLDRRPDLFEQGSQLVGRDGQAVHLNAFLDAGQVRRGEQAGAVAGLAQDGGQHGRGGAFALAAGDVDDPQAFVRIAQQSEQGPHPVELEITGAAASAARS